MTDFEGVADNFYQRAKCSVNVIIVGAGVAGLALAGVLGKSGHKVTVLEAASAIAEVDFVSSVLTQTPY